MSHVASLSVAAPFTVLIPARMAATRLPDKPLVDIVGVPMVVHVARRAAQSAALRCVVAADDMRIVQACHIHGVQALLTRKDHPSGSDRLAEACDLLALGDDDIVVNVQGDEPLIEPQLINAVAALLSTKPQAQICTAACPIDGAGAARDFANPNVVKTVLDAQGFALYFSRAAIPHMRGSGQPQTLTPLLRHIGIYSYRAKFLRRFPLLSPAPIEAVEALEQLRALWHGWRIAVHIAASTPATGVDTPADLERVRALLR